MLRPISGRAAERVHDGLQAVGEPGLAQIAKPGAEQHGLARQQSVGDDQPVERVILGGARQHGGDRRLDHICTRHDRIGGLALVELQQEVVDAAQAIVERRRHFLDHAETEILERRDR